MHESLQCKPLPWLRVKDALHTKGTVLLVCFQWVDTLASKQAKGMSLRYDVICTFGIGDAAWCFA